jgi:hypothetical protein
MTEEEVLRAFEGKAVRLEKPYSLDGVNAFVSIKIDDFDIGGTKLGVVFLMSNEDKKLRRVVLGKSDPFGKFIGEEQIKVIERGIRGKYGIPAKRKEERKPDYSQSVSSGMMVFWRGAYGLDVSWNLANTGIDLSYYCNHLPTILVPGSNDPLPSKSETPLLDSITKPSPQSTQTPIIDPLDRTTKESMKQISEPFESLNIAYYDLREIKNRL